MAIGKNSNKRPQNCLTVGDRFLHHIYKLRNDECNYYHTEQKTLKGICSALKCDPSMAWRAGEQMRAEGLVFRKKERIENNIKKQYVYDLTDDGEKIAIMIDKQVKESKKKNEGIEKHDNGS